MKERKYRVLINEELVATNMDIKIALVLIRALFEEYDTSQGMVINIKEEMFATERI